MTWPRKRTITRDKSKEYRLEVVSGGERHGASLLWVLSVSHCLCMVWQTSVYQTLALPNFLWIVFLPFGAPDPYPLLLSSGGHISLNGLTVEESLIVFVWFPYICNEICFSLVNPSHVNVMNKPAKTTSKGRENFVLSYKTKGLLPTKTPGGVVWKGSICPCSLGEEPGFPKLIFKNIWWTFLNLLSLSPIRNNLLHSEY